MQASWATNVQRQCSVGRPGQGDRYCGISTGTQIDKSKLFRIFTGEWKHSHDSGLRRVHGMQLVQSVDLGADYFFIGEIVAAYAHQRVLTNGKPSMYKLKPLMLTMPITCIGRSANLWKKHGP
jgi:hypothetical protein